MAVAGWSHAVRIEWVASEVGYMDNLDSDAPSTCAVVGAMIEVK